ncbi:MAG: hypothetical protein ACJA1O_001209, partial [Spirosomataceae bacterium]
MKQDFDETIPSNMAPELIPLYLSNEKL